MSWNDTCTRVSTVSSVSLKGGSRERKEQKGTGGRRTGFGKREVVKERKKERKNE